MTIDTGIIDNLGLGQRQAAEQADKTHLGQQEFLNLMIAQMRNQDPFKPMDGGQFIGQLAQFGTVSGIADMQKSMAELAGAVRGNQTLQAAALVDRDVWVVASEAFLPPDGGSVRVRADAPEGATNVTLRVYDLTGQEIALVPADAGADGAFEWDGALPGGGRAEPGFYELRASAHVDGEPVAIDTLVSGRVESVSTSSAGGGLKLTVTGVGNVDFTSVRDIG